LSGTFLKYRREWYADPKGWNRDPHEKQFLDEHETEANREKFGALFQIMEETKVFALQRGTPASPGDDWVEGFSPKSIMTTHANPRNVIYEQALKAGDGLDSAQDRNNPLWSAEQTNRRATLADNALRPYVFRSNVFGFEGEETRVDYKTLDAKRAKLYRLLDNEGILKNCWKEDQPGWQAREALLRHLRESYELACSDTTRPANDTSLWEHTYAVAALTKALQAHYVIYGENKGPREAKDYFRAAHFTMLGVGWDAVRFIGRGQKIYDLSARRGLLKDLRTDIRKMIEYDYVLGNSIYEDDGSIIFLIPEVMSNDAGKAYAVQLEKIQEEMALHCFRESTGETWPYFARLPDGGKGGESSGWGRTRETTGIVKVLTELRKERPTIIVEAGQVSDLVLSAQELVSGQQWNGADVCPICGLRPARERVEVGRICEICLDRRMKRAAKERDEAKGKPDERFAPTPFISEIADRNRRVALLVGRFGLNHWLNGDMVRSLFVSEAHGLSREVEELGLARQFEKEELEIRGSLVDLYGASWATYDYNRIKQGMELCYIAGQCHLPEGSPELHKARSTFFLYDRRVAGRHINRCPDDTEQNKWPEEAPRRIDSEFVNRKNAKTPTPSTILDVWQTTEEFLRSICKSNVGASWGPPPLLAKVLPPLHRWRMAGSAKEFFDREDSWALYSGKVDDAEIEFYFEDGTGPVRLVHVLYNRRELREGDFAGKTITDIRDDDRRRITVNGETPAEIKIVHSPEPSPEYFLPFREILATPEYFLALIPAELALPATQQIVEEYRKRFGKVWGRLPLSLGNIFFPQHTPMFIVLDAARRMLRNFADLGSELPQKKWTVKRAERVGSEIELEMGTDSNSPLRWRLPLLLGDGQTDYYHPYFIVDADDQVKSAPSFFEVPNNVGAVAHFTDVRSGTQLKLVNSVYDFEFLDTSAARFRISQMQGSHRRPNPILNDSPVRPIRLEEVDQKVMRTWEILTKSGISDTGLRDMIGLLLMKLQEWQVRLPVGVGSTSINDQEWVALVEQQVGSRFAEYGKKTCDFLVEQLRSGLFFETAALYLHITKERLGEARRPQHKLDEDAGTPQPSTVGAP
jgi:hypothetical protein